MMFEEIEYERLTIKKLVEISQYYKCTWKVTGVNKSVLIDQLKDFLRKKSISNDNLHPYLLEVYQPKKKKEFPVKVGDLQKTVHYLARDVKKIRFDLVPDKMIDLLFIYRDIRKPPVGKKGIQEALDMIQDMEPAFFRKIHEMNLEEPIVNEHPSQPLYKKLKLFLKGAMMGLDMKPLEDDSNDVVLDILINWERLALPVSNAKEEKEENTKKLNRYNEKEEEEQWKELVGQMQDVRKLQSLYSVTQPEKNYLSILEKIQAYQVHLVRKTLLEDNLEYPSTVSYKLFQYLLKAEFTKVDFLYRNYVRVHNIPSPIGYVHVVDKYFLLTHGCFYEPIRAFHKESMKRKRFAKDVKMHNALDALQKRALYQLYDTQTHFDPMFDILFKKERYDELETLIAHLYDVPIKTLADSIGMWIPKCKTEEEERFYLIENMKEYTKLKSRRTKLLNERGIITIDVNSVSYLTDGEVFSCLNIYLPYRNRKELIERTQKYLMGKDQFFIPTAALYPKAINKTTPLMLTSITKEYNEMFIAYGCIQKFIIYEVDDLLLSFAEIAVHNGVKRMFFRVPTKSGYYFEPSDVDALVVLLENFHALTQNIEKRGKEEKTMEGGFGELVKKIKQGLELNQRSTGNEYDVYVRQKFTDILQESERKKIRSFLYQLFYIGMYMRRWKGPGHIYPEFNCETRDQDVDPTDMSLEPLVQARVILDSFTSQRSRTFCNNLRLISLYEGMQMKQEETVLYLLQKIGEEPNDKYCIRVSSSTFVATGYFYLRLLFQETIPNVHIRQLQNIQ